MWPRMIVAQRGRASHLPKSSNSAKKMTISDMIEKDSETASSMSPGYRAPAGAHEAERGQRAEDRRDDHRHGRDLEARDERGLDVGSFQTRGTSGAHPAEHLQRLARVERVDDHDQDRHEQGQAHGHVQPTGSAGDRSPAPAAPRWATRSQRALARGPRRRAQVEHHEGSDTDHEADLSVPPSGT